MGNTPSTSTSTSTPTSCYNFQKATLSERYQYIMQMNEGRVDRFQVQHHIYREVLRSNFSAPITDTLKQGASVLDLGCGPGMWVCEMATDYRASIFHGIDYHNIFPTQKPVNAQFIKANLLERLPFKDANFDFVYIRSLVFAFKPDQYENVVLKEAIRMLRPNAFIEVIRTKLITNKMDPSITLKMPSILYKYDKSLKRVRDQQIKINIGRFGGKIGEIQADLCIRLLREESKMIRGLFKLNAKEYEEFVEGFIKELNTHAVYMIWYKYWAQKKG
ncbi:8666_t:CDS:2 [Ambispora gerdemannii]|uniref:8666_t:CDS:1 n=1 Tax=Ambispora gerdemannii TaxID=144530 RepID=A0A9N9CKG8_9GLOM|nr:8666_t:CDS:2 [Ambispora gerdemannii]